MHPHAELDPDDHDDRHLPSVRSSGGAGEAVRRSNGRWRLPNGLAPIPGRSSISDIARRREIHRRSRPPSGSQDRSGAIPRDSRGSPPFPMGRHSRPSTPIGGGAPAKLPPMLVVNAAARSASGCGGAVDAPGGTAEAIVWRPFSSVAGVARRSSQPAPAASAAQRVISPSKRPSCAPPSHVRNGSEAKEREPELGEGFEETRVPNGVAGWSPRPRGFCWPVEKRPL